MAGRPLTDPAGWHAKIPHNACQIQQEEIQQGTKGRTNKVPVYIPELQPKNDQTAPKTYHWVYNKQGHNLSCTSEGTCGGSYVPPTYGATKDSPDGTPVLVKFREEDSESGYIADYITAQTNKGTAQGKCSATGSSDSGGKNSTFDTFKTHIAASTPDGNNITIVGKDSTGAYSSASRSINIVFENGASVITLNPNGVNIHSSANLNVSISGNVNLNCSGTVNLQASGPVNIDGSAIYLNSSKASNTGCSGTPVPTQGGGS